MPDVVRETGRVRLVAQVLPEEEKAAGPNQAGGDLETAIGVLHVVEDVDNDDEVERPRCERQRLDRMVVDLDPPPPIRLGEPPAPIADVPTGERIAADDAARAPVLEQEADVRIRPTAELDHVPEL